MFKTPLSRFRIISYIEGLSYLVLLFIAMPIKYLGDNPLPVKFAGMTHGVLFIIFVLILLECMKRLEWKIGFSIKLFILSLIPFGFLLIEKEAKKLEETKQSA